MWANTILTESSPEYLTVRNPCDITMSKHSELTEDQLTVSSLLPLCGELIEMILRTAHSKVTVWVANSQKAHSVSHLVSSLWANWVSSKWGHQGFNLSSQWVSCELKFFTWWVTFGKVFPSLLLLRIWHLLVRKRQICWHAFFVLLQTVYYTPYTMLYEQKWT